MEYRILGRSGLRVSRVALGTMTFGDDWGWGAPHEEARKIFDAYADRGGNFVDMANVYTGGTSERLVGEFVAGDRERFVLATKYGYGLPGDGANAAGIHRKSLVRSVERSLERLGTDRLDLLWVHAWDFSTPVEEVVRALDDLVRSGKVLHVGFSDTPAWVVSRADVVARDRGWTRPVAIQAEYSAVQRTPERELIPMARALDLAVVGWSPLAGGLLTGKYRSEPPADDRGAARRLDVTDFVPYDERARRIADAVVEAADEIGRAPASVALRWILDRGVVPIVGARTVEHLEQNLEALEAPLDEAARRRIDETSAVDLGFPHEFLARSDVRGLLTAGLAEEVEIPVRV